MLASITLGRALRTAHSEWFIFTETAHAPGTVLATHWHERSAISYIAAGARRYRFESTVVECVAGSIIFVAAGASHTSEFFDEPARGLMIESRARPACPQFTSASHQPELSLLCEAMLREMAVADHLMPPALNALAFELFARVCCDDRPTWLDHVREILDESLFRPMRLSEIAAAANVDRSRLTRSFRRHHGVSIGTYLRRLRASRAWQLVATTDTPLSEVAAVCGFADQSHLTRAFQRTFGIAPGGLRAARLPRVFKTPLSSGFRLKA